MRFVIVGAGAIGGVIGGRLYEAGHEVALVARGAHLARVVEDGLELRSPSGTVSLPVPAVGALAELEPREDDVVLLAVKSQDTAAVLPTIAQWAGNTVPVACAQNGVDNERCALRLFDRVYGVVVMCPTSHVEPGVVEAHSSPVTGVLDVGRYPEGVDEMAEELAAMLRTATFDSHAIADVGRWKWAKLLTNLANAVEALCGTEAARSGQLGRLARREGFAVLSAAGIAFASREEDAARRGDTLQVRSVAGRGRTGGSTWQSLARHVPTVETDYLNGEIALLGRMHGVATPVNSFLQRHLRECALAGAEPGSVSEAELLMRLGVSVDEHR